MNFNLLNEFSLSIQGEEKQTNNQIKKDRSKITNKMTITGTILCTRFPSRVKSCTRRERTTFQVPPILNNALADVSLDTGVETTLLTLGTRSIGCASRWTCPE